jgi:serine/threonine protein kinase
MVDSEIPATELVDDCFHYLRVNQKRTHSLAELQQHLLNPPTQLVYYPNCLNNLFEQISKRPYSATKPNLQAQLPTVTASTYLIHASTAYPSSLPSLQNSNASQRLGHSQALPALSEQVPQQWKLWDQEITLTNNHPTETVKWEILAPFSADQFGFFTCAHRLEGQALIDAQKLADSQSNTIADCYPTSGMIGPNGKVKLLFSFVLFEQIRFNRLVLIDLEYADYKSTCPISVFLEGKEDPTQKYWLVPEREVLRGSRIGKGAFGSVFAATIRGLKCALKSWTGTKTFNAFGVCRIDLPSDFKKELAVFQTTKHRHLIPFIGAFQSETDTNAFILLKFASSGSLDRYYNVQRHGKAWTYLMGFKLALEAARGLQYLHSQGVFHRDVKSLNILVDEGEARINDFGAARLVASSDLQTVVSMHGQRHGTRYWIAPEVMNRTMDRTYTAASDVFSFGLVLFELATGELPARHEAQAKAGYFPPLPLDFCKKFPDYLEIYHRCVSFDPKKRPDFNEIVGVLESIEHRQRAIEQPAAGRKLGGSTGHRSRPSGGGALDADPFGQPSPTGSFLQQVESPALPQSSSFTPSIQHAPQAGGYASPSSSDIPSSKPHSMSPTTHYQ